MVAAYRDGRATAQGRQPRRNPWDSTDADVIFRVLAMMWARGYSAGNPINVP